MRVCASLSSVSELEECDTRMVEIRLDLLGSVPEVRDRDLLVTYRGPIDLDVLPEGFDGMIDIGEEHRPDTHLKVVASHHDFTGTPNAERIASILNGMDCDIAKGAFSVGSFRDLTSILDAARSLKRPHVILGMGALGTVTRIRASILGNEFSFGYVGEPTAPGQLRASDMEMLGDDCMILGLVGSPISKSRSPAMHNAALKEADVNGVYLPFDTTDLDQMEEVVRGYDIRGLNVTIPYKQDIMDHLDSVDRDASAIGAVNTVINENGRLVGRNTDVLGIHTALTKAGFEAEDRRVLIMGSGGAARSCAHYMTERGCDVTITGRNAESGSGLASEFGATFRCGKSVSVMMYDIIVNCTPVGMYSDGPYPINISAIQQEQTIFDMVYGKETALIHQARSRGCRVAYGEDMLAGQGAASFEMWTGIEGMFDTMRSQI